MNLIVVACKQLQPLHLLSVEDLRLHKIFEIFVVHENLNGKFCALEPMSPIL